MSMNLVEVLPKVIGEDGFSALAKIAGIDGVEKVRGALTAITPALVHGLAEKAAVSEGEADILQRLQLGGFMADSQPFAEQLTDAAALTKTQNQGNDLLGWLFGGRLAAITDWVASSTGINRGGAASLLALISPLMMSFIGKKAQAESLSAAGLGALLAEEGKLLGASMPAGLASAFTGHAVAAAAPSSSADGHGHGGAHGGHTAHDAHSDGVTAPLWKWLVPVGIAVFVYFGVKSCGIPPSPGNAPQGTAQLGQPAGSGSSPAVPAGQGAAPTVPAAPATPGKVVVEATRDAAGDLQAKGAAAVEKGKELASGAISVTGIAVESAKDAAGDLQAKGAAAVEKGKELAAGAVSATGAAVEAAKDAAGDLQVKGAAAVEKGKELAAGAVSATGAAVEAAKDATIETAAKAGTEAKEMLEAAIRWIMLKLPGGKELKAPENGIEHNMLTFIEDSSRPVDKTTWFTFDGLEFDTASAVIRASSQERLQNVAAILAAYPQVTIKIGGYTDNVGEPANNLTLSQKRADSTKQALVRFGVAAERMDAEGYGEEYPVAENTTAAGRQKNRRIDFRITNK